MTVTGWSGGVRCPTWYSSLHGILMSRRQAQNRSARCEGTGCRAAAGPMTTQIVGGTSRQRPRHQCVHVGGQRGEVGATFPDHTARRPVWHAEAPKRGNPHHLGSGGGLSRPGRARSDRLGTPRSLARRPRPGGMRSRTCASAGSAAADHPQLGEFWSTRSGARGRSTHGSPRSGARSPERKSPESRSKVGARRSELLVGSWYGAAVLHRLVRHWCCSTAKLVLHGCCNSTVFLVFSHHRSPVDNCRRRRASATLWGAPGCTHTRAGQHRSPDRKCSMSPGAILALRKNCTVHWSCIGAAHLLRTPTADAAAVVLYRRRCHCDRRAMDAERRTVRHGARADHPVRLAGGALKDDPWRRCRRQGW